MSLYCMQKPGGKLMTETLFETQRECQDRAFTYLSDYRWVAACWKGRDAFACGLEKHGYEIVEVEVRRVRRRR